MTIQGPGSAQLIIDGNAQSRIFSIVETSPPGLPFAHEPADLPVTISGMTLRNGQRNVLNSVGGAIYSNKSLAISDLAFDNNRARGGGAIWFATQYAGQTLTVQNSRFSGNQAKEIVAGSTSGHIGGAIGIGENCGGTRTQPVTVAITDSDFFANVAQAGPSFNARGGAIYFCCDADVTITRTTIEESQAAPPIVANPNVNALGGGISGAAKTLTIRDSTLAANRADRHTALHLFNDALVRQTVQERMIASIVNSTISGNRGLQHSTVLAFANVELKVKNSTIVGNVSEQNRTAGIYLGTGPTTPASASNALAPTLAVESSVLWNPLGQADIGKDGSHRAGCGRGAHEQHDRRPPLHPARVRPRGRSRSPARATSSAWIRCSVRSPTTASRRSRACRSSAAPRSAREQRARGSPPTSAGRASRARSARSRMPGPRSTPTRRSATASSTWWATARSARACRG